MAAKPRALYYRILKYQPENLERLRREFVLTELEDPSHDSDEVLAHTEVLFAPLGYPVDRVKIDRCANLKVIGSNTTGHPHIDVDYAKERQIAVACLKFAPEFLQRVTPTAELTWGLIIMLTRGLIPAHHAALQGNWDRRPFGAPTMLSRMSLGVIGHGRLGGLVARYGRAFGMRVNYFDPFVASSSEGAQSYSSLEDLVSESDIVSLHVPHEPETEGLFSAHLFECMRRGSYFINTARGELMDWNALLIALERGHLAGAALDVFEGEFALDFKERYPDHPLLEYARRHPNLILTPHIGGSTKDAWRMTEAHTLDMVMEAIRQRAMPGALHS